MRKIFLLASLIFSADVKSDVSGFVGGVFEFVKSNSVYFLTIVGANANKADNEGLSSRFIKVAAASSLLFYLAQRNIDSGPELAKYSLALGTIFGCCDLVSQAIVNKKTENLINKVPVLNKIDPDFYRMLISCGLIIGVESLNVD